MGETYVERFLSSLLYSYSEELDKNNINLSSIFPGITLKLNDIVIYKNSLLQHGLPLYVQNGIISEVFMKISLTENSTIDISDIYFYLSFVDSHNFPDSTTFHEIRDHQLYAHELFKDNFSYITNKFILSTFKQIIKNTISKSTITIKNVYICLELFDCIISIYIDKLLLVGNQANTDDQELTLNLSIFNLKVLMLPKSENSIIDLTDNTTFTQSMKAYFDQISNLNMSDFLLNIEEMDGTVLYTEDQQFKININNEDKIETLLNLKLWQVSSLIKVIPEFSKFKNRFLVRFIEKPSFDNPQDSWDYFHRCATQLNANKGTTLGKSSPLFSQFVKGFINRNKYMRTWQDFKHKPFNPVLLNELDHSLTYRQITLFRYLTEILRKKWMRRPLTKDNVYEALDFIDMDVPNLLTFLIKRSTININLSKVIFNVYFQDTTKYLFTLSLIKPIISLYFDKSDNFIIASSFSSFKLKDNSNSALIESVENEPNAFKFNLEFYSKSYQLNNNIKDNLSNNDSETIYNDLTVMRVQCTVSNQNFVISALEIINILSQIDLNQMISIATSLFKLDSLIHDNRNTSFLYSFLEMVDIDFRMSNCQFSLILNDKCQLNYIADTITLKRELQKLEMEIQEKSVNSKIKKSENIRTLFKKSDLSFDITTSSVVFGYDRFNHILITSISVHTIFMASKKELIVFISPLYVNSSWFEIKQLSLILEDYIKSFRKKKIQNNIQLEVPPFLKEIKISGGIPTITISLDFPAFPNKLFELLIDTIKFEGKFEDEIEWNATVNKISFENFLEILDTKVNLKDHRFEFEKVRFSMLKTLSILPKDALDIINLSPLTSNFSFLMKTLSVDLAVDWIEPVIDYTVTNFGGYSDYLNDGSLKLTAFVNDISINHKPIIVNQEVTAQIDLNKSINIFVEFGDLEFLFQHDLLDFIFNSDIRVKDIFPKDFVLNWKIKVNSLLLDPLARIENCWVYLIMSDLMFGGDIFFETLEVIHMKIEQKNPMSISADLSKHYLSAVVDLDYVEVDVLPLLSLAQFFIHYPFHINLPITFDVKIMPLTVGLILNPDRPIHPILNIYNENDNGETQTYQNAFYLNMRSVMYFNGERISANIQLNDLDVFYNEHKFFSMPNLTIFGERQWGITIPSIDISFNSLSQISTILDNLSKIPTLSIQMWHIRHSLTGILNSIKITSLRLLFSQSVLINVQDILASIPNNEVNIRCDINSLIYSTWFACNQFAKIDDLKLYFCFDSQNLIVKLLNENPINIQIDDRIVAKLHNLLNSEIEKSFLTIKNETNFEFDSKFGQIHPKSSISNYEYIHDDEIELNCEFGKISVRRDELTNKGELEVLFDNYNFYLSLNNQLELKINTKDSIKNKSSVEFTFEYDSESYTIQPNSLMNFNFEIEHSFKLNNKEVKFNENETDVIFNDLYMIKRLKRLILIQPQFFLVNELPFDVKLDQITYKSYSTSEFLSPISNEHSIIIESESFKTQKLELNELKHKQYFSLKLKMIYDFNMPFVVRVQFLNNRKGSRKVVISPSAIIRSKLKNLLVSPDKVNCFSINRNTDFAFSTKKKMISRVFLTISEDFGFSEITLNEKNVHKEVVVLNSNKDEFQIYPFIIEREIKPYPYYNIEILTIKPYITIHNDLNDRLFIYYPDSKYLIIEANQTAEIEQFESTLDFCFSVGKVSNLNQLLNSIHVKANGEINQYPFILNFKTIKSEKVVLNGSQIPIEINVNTTSENSSKTITFSICKSFSYRLINLSNYSLFIQKREFKPKTASLFTPSQKFLNKNDKLKISIKEANNKIALGQIGQQKVQCREKQSDTETITISTENYQDDLLGQFETPLYSYEEHNLINNSIVHTVVVSEDIEDINKIKYQIMDSQTDENNYENKNIQLKLSLEALFSKIVLVLFTGQNNKEISLFAHNLLIVASSQQLTNQNEYQMNGIRLSIAQIEMLDFYKNCLLLSKDETEFLRIFADNIFSQFHIETMKISMNPFYFNANLAIIFEYMKLFTEFKEILQKYSDYMNIPTIFDNGLIENLIFDPISLLFEFDTSSPNFSSFFKIVPSIKPVHFSTQKVELENVRFNNKIMTNSAVRFNNRELSKKEKVYLMVKNSLKFVFSMNIFGAPLSLFETMFLDFSKPFNVSFKKFKFSSLFVYCISIFENIVDYARSFCYCLAGQDNPRKKGESSPLIWGFTSLFMSVFNAVTLSLSVLFRDKHLVQSIFAFIFTIFGGMFDGASGALTFLRNCLNGHSEIEKEFLNDSDKPKKIRSFNFLF